MRRLRTLALTAAEAGAVRSLVSITLDSGEADAQEAAKLRRVLRKLDALDALCSNCGSSRHLECCSRCGRSVPETRRQTGYCTEVCAHAQRIEDRLSAQQEDAHG